MNTGEWEVSIWAGDGEGWCSFLSFKAMRICAPECGDGGFRSFSSNQLEGTNPRDKSELSWISKLGARVSKSGVLLWWGGRGGFVCGRGQPCHVVRVCGNNLLLLSAWFLLPLSIKCGVGQGRCERGTLQLLFGGHRCILPSTTYKAPIASDWGWCCVQLLI